jgi:hypothetical protein
MNTSAYLARRVAKCRAAPAGRGQPYRNRIIEAEALRAGKCAAQKCCSSWSE